MRLRKRFHFKDGTSEDYDCDHYDLDVLTASRLVIYHGELFDWIMYDADPAPGIDYILHYTQIDPATVQDRIVDEIISISPRAAACVCGTKAPIGQNHSFTCDRYKKEMI